MPSQLLRGKSAASATSLAPSPHGKAASSGKGRLDISVAPKLATIMVDGAIVRTGSIEVTPDENHKVQVEMSGYKPCLQYYRVRSGDVRKIEIFLEKATKHSLFGL